MITVYVAGRPVAEFSFEWQALDFATDTAATLQERTEVLVRGPHLVSLHLGSRPRVGGCRACDEAFARWALPRCAMHAACDEDDLDRVDALCRCSVCDARAVVLSLVDHEHYCYRHADEREQPAVTESTTPARKAA